ncbi:MAG: DUF2304 domain-containing protein, partial [Planctomycetales bacterium]
SIRRGRFREKYGLAWIFIGVGMLSVPFLHNVYFQVGKFFGIVDPTSFFLLIAVFSLFLLTLQCTLALSSSYKYNRRLVQQCGLLENRIRNLEMRCPMNGGDPEYSDQAT